MEVLLRIHAEWGIVRSARDRSKSGALKKLRAKLRDRDDGIPSDDAHYSVAQAIWDWLTYGLHGREEATVTKNAANVRREFRKVISRADLVGAEWTPREIRHSFVSLLSDNGMALENIARLVGHKGGAITEKVYRLQIRPVMEEGATAMDRIFPSDTEEPAPGSQSGKDQ
ncbi:tyrosine-type recombinase/integrase [Nonomuraea angiospora]|uniref:tyrosine-type recombinase/integrase n=1 Tax=Nonomuraea angiospora TaxID=46172 RepID=UPI00344C0653